MLSTQSIVESGILFVARASLLFGCRKYLLRTVYTSLTSLSGSDKDIELHELPTPSTHRTNSPIDSTRLHTTLSRTIFSWAFSECCMMFLLLVLQGVNTFSSQTRLMNWRFSLFSLVTIILVVIPASISLLLSLGTSKFTIWTCCGPRGLVYFPPVLLYLFALSYIPLPLGLKSPDLTTNVLSRLIVLGTVILGLLSGFGAVSNSWSFVPFLSGKSTPPTDAEIQAAEYSLSSIRADISQRRLRASNTGSQPSWISRVGASFRGGDDSVHEMRGLESLEYEMVKTIEALRQRRDAAVFAVTWKGLLWNSVGRLFALYCATRIMSCLYNVIYLPSHRSTSNLNYSDVLSSILAYGISHLSSTSINDEDVASFSRHLSLALVGLIIITSVRYVLRGVTRALRISSRSMGASLMLLFLAQIMGIYLLSTVVQMRASFPPPPDDINLFSTIPEYELFGSLFDWTFLLMALASTLVRWGTEKVNRVGND